MRHPDDYTPEQWARIFGVPVSRIWQDTQPLARRNEAANAPELEPAPPEDQPRRASKPAADKA